MSFATKLLPEMLAMLIFNKVARPEKILLDCLEPYLLKKAGKPKDFDPSLWPKQLPKVSFPLANQPLTSFFQDDFVLFEIVLHQANVILLGANLQAVS